MRPDIAGNMGAFGAALLARDRYHSAVALEARKAEAGAAWSSESEQLAAPVAVGSSLLSLEQLAALSPTHKTVRCKACSNHCLLTVNDFGVDETTGKHRRFITGNRCEKGAGTLDESKNVPNLYEYKSSRLFDYEPLAPENAPRGSVGIPRALNQYENYPFWFTFFTKLGWRVVLSDPSTKKTYEAGIESMPSESVCYPAKLSHGHIMNLLDKAPDFIWFPCSKWERQEDEGAGNHFNCPIVASYPEALRLNIDELRTSDVNLLTPWLPYDQKEHLKKRLFVELVEAHPELMGSVAAPTQAEVDAAVDAAWAEDEAFKRDIRAKGEETLAWMEATGTHGIVLGGRPYHNDPEINHAIPELLTSFGLAVLTEDSIAHLGTLERPIRLVGPVDVPHPPVRGGEGGHRASRPRPHPAQQLRLRPRRADHRPGAGDPRGGGQGVHRAQDRRGVEPGRGAHPRALAAGGAQRPGRREGRRRNACRAAAPPSASIPTRSRPRPRRPSTRRLGQTEAAIAAKLTGATPETFTQKAAPEVAERFRQREGATTEFPRAVFTQEMKDAGYTILCPQMAPIHFDLLVDIFKRNGYNFELLPSVDHGAVDAGLKYVNNDICYPSVLVTGQIMEAVMSGRYDTDKLAVIITQTGGGCRATNYISLIRKALASVGLPHIPVIALSFKDLGESNPGFKVTPSMLLQAAYAIFYGDLLMMALYRTRPYEVEEGSANRLFDHWMTTCKAQLRSGLKRGEFKKTVRRIVEDFDTLPLAGEGLKPRVGVVGEILVKFHPTANNQIVDVIEREGCEAVVPGLAEFFLFGIAGGIFQKGPLGRSAKGALGSRIGLWAIAKMRAPVTKALQDSSRFEPPADIYELAEYASEILSLCNSMGEGWLLTAEMVELIKTGAPNVVCTQPFACLPNHVVGKAVIKELRRRYPESNIVAVDYDPGASEVNQLNRIKLMISVAKANLADKEAEAKKARDRFVDAGRPQAVQEEAGALEIETERA